MAVIHYITGGERSGKSGYAQKLALSMTDRPYYLATSRIEDEDFAERVERHLGDRDERWTTIEEEKLIGEVDVTGQTVVLDCVTLWLTNWYMDTECNVNESLDQGKAQLEKLFAQDATLIIISNEIGMGLHAETHMGRKFTELQGWMNQFIARKADRAVFMVSGLPINIK
jgi:adenosylcobinamide kinase/adenosylcobinamide-phosphate guanylyltransferase